MTDKDKKWLMIGSGVVAVIVIINLTRSKTDTSGSLEDPTGNGGNSSANAPFNADYVATNLYDIMKGSFTDEQDIMDALKNVNAYQFQQVIIKFAKQSYNTTTGNQYNFWPLTPLPLEPLKVWLRTELSDSKYNTLRLKYQSLNYL
ncbi:hypothetical protein GR160_02865 [Flavobacterium sp. Sd200]|uniref:hypothetical protein n=1 Tax=Flavobacterium sp. Sd200 TaxID=2692211 RepID=UPI00136A056E|nr:hypothetical protein [Flavobacterium sp. Sd200]MXN90155.1 hypothetical protein [Flavobacterium sp. Sd200]